MKKPFFLLFLVFLCVSLYAFSYPEVEVTAGISPTSTSFIDFYHGNDIDGAKSFMTAPWGASASLEVAAFYEPGFGLSARGGFSMERKEETIYPKAYNMYYSYLLLGPEVRFALRGKVSAFFGVEVGLGAVANANVTNVSESLGLKGGIRFPLGEHFYVGAESRMMAILSLTKDPYFNSVSLQTESLVLDFGWRL